MKISFIKIRFRYEAGFSLVELSIVIIVLGLLVASFLVGNSIVKQSKLLVQISQLQEYKNAYESFKLQFKAIPGDFNKAENYWNGSKNGDANGRITNDIDGFNNASMYSDPSFEAISFFEHLSNAELVDNKFGHEWKLEVGFPALKYDYKKGMGAGGAIQGFLGRLDLSNAEKQKRYVAILGLNISRPQATVVSQYNDILGVFTPQTSHAIDKKMDDGFANKGVFKTHTANLNTLTAEESFHCLDGEDGDYLLASTKFVCHSIYILEE